MERENNQESILQIFTEQSFLILLLNNFFFHLQEFYDLQNKYKQQTRELKEVISKQKITMEQYTDTSDV